jgi:hypothetical protein
MRTTCRNRNPIEQLHLYPDLRECPRCHRQLVERYRKRRWIVQLSGQLEVIGHCLQCPDASCPMHQALYRPEAEDRLALRGYTFGLDVVAKIGQLRYYGNQTITDIHHQLQDTLTISIKEIALLCEVFLALVNTVASQDQELLESLQQLGSIVLSIDGVQPEKGNETLYLLREVRLGRVLVARNLASSTTPEIEALIQEVLALGIPVIGVVSDKQHSICLAVERQLPDVPHQICHYHFLKDLAQPLCEVDRNFKKQLKHQIRQFQPIIRLATAQSEVPEAEIVQGYGLAIRQVLQQDGIYPLEPSGVQLFRNLQAISNSVARVMQHYPSQLINRLLNRLACLSNYQNRFKQLCQGFDAVHRIAELLEGQSNENQAQQQLQSYIAQWINKLGATDSAESEVLNTWGQHFERITNAFLPKLFAYCRQPLLPHTNNALEIFIGRLKKTRRKITGRKNVQAFILHEGAWVATLLSLPVNTNWQESFIDVNYQEFQRNLKRLRRATEQSKLWHIRHDLAAYLLDLESSQ